MAARQAFAHEALSETSTTTSGSWPGATTFSFTPDANFDYWIIFSCLFANGSGTAGHYGEVSLYHDQGSTSVGYWANRAQEISSPQDWFGVFCVHKSAFGASPGQQDYIVSINSSSHSGDATKIKDIRFLAIKADGQVCRRGRLVARRSRRRLRDEDDADLHAGLDRRLLADRQRGLDQRGRVQHRHSPQPLRDVWRRSWMRASLSPGRPRSRYQNGPNVDEPAAGSLPVMIDLTLPCVRKTGSGTPITCRVGMRPSCAVSRSRPGGRR